MQRHQIQIPSRQDSLTTVRIGQTMCKREDGNQLYPIP